MMCLVTLLIPGLSSLFGPHARFWLELSAYLFCTLAVVLLIVEERREHMARRERRMSMASPRGSGRWIPPEVKSSAARATKLLGLTLLGGILGYLWREHQFNSNHYIYAHVQVVERYGPASFLVHPAGMPKSYQVDFDTPQDFAPGQRMRSLAFEQRLGVKHLLWADFCPDYCDQNGKRLTYKEEVVNVGY